MSAPTTDDARLSRRERKGRRGGKWKDAGEHLPTTLDELEADEPGTVRSFVRDGLRICAVKHADQSWELHARPGIRAEVLCDWESTLRVRRGLATPEAASE